MCVLIKNYMSSLPGCVLQDNPGGILMRYSNFKDAHVIFKNRLVKKFSTISNQIITDTVTINGIKVAE